MVAFQRSLLKALVVFAAVLSAMLFLCTVQHGIDTTASVAYSIMGSCWMFIHIAAFPFVVAGMAYKQAWTSPSWLSAVAVAAYWTHQFEEHGYDLFGRRYHFINHLADVLGCRTLQVTTTDAGYLTATGCHDVGVAFIAWANVYMIDLGFLFPLFVPKARRYIAVANTLGIIFMNALVFHIIAGVKAGKYNPGLLQSVFVNLPFSGYALYRMHSARLLSTPQLVFALVGIGLGVQMGIVVVPTVLAMAGKLSGTALHIILLIVPTVALPALSMFVGTPTSSAKASVDALGIMREDELERGAKKQGALNRSDLAGRELDT